MSNTIPTFPTSALIASTTLAQTPAPSPAPTPTTQEKHFFKDHAYVTGSGNFEATKPFTQEGTERPSDSSDKGVAGFGGKAGFGMQSNPENRLLLQGETTYSYQNLTERNLKNGGNGLFGTQGLAQGSLDIRVAAPITLFGNNDWKFRLGPQIHFSPTLMQEALDSGVEKGGLIANPQAYSGIDIGVTSGAAQLESPWFRLGGGARILFDLPTDWLNIVADGNLDFVRGFAITSQQSIPYPVTTMSYGGTLGLQGTWGAKPKPAPVKTGDTYITLPPDNSCPPDPSPIDQDKARFNVWNKHIDKTNREANSVGKPELDKINVEIARVADNIDASSDMNVEERATLYIDRGGKRYYLYGEDGLPLSPDEIGRWYEKEQSTVTTTQTGNQSWAAFINMWGDNFNTDIPKDPSRATPTKPSVENLRTARQSGDAAFERVARAIFKTNYPTLIQNTNNLALALNNPNIKTQDGISITDCKVQIIGHTDSDGKPDYNMILGQSRANAAKEILLHSGIDESRIETLSMGESQPIDTNDTADGKAANRRVEMKIVDPSGNDVTDKFFGSSGVGVSSITKPNDVKWWDGVRLVTIERTDNGSNINGSIITPNEGENPDKEWFTHSNSQTFTIIDSDMDAYNKCQNGSSGSGTGNLATP